ncbi:hypothetical protein RhiirC2_871284 [Rhizophagus irregularis]|uniref:Uncharacterized protein n=1 Tax=Rhizophagus irregularis TaxID=588596 RepID=A0A2N1MCM4_9GLOM|nr:hypothetical protein RhiirC2_871284 [Rhizophagus irregularis]
MCPDRHNWPGNDIGQETIMSEGQNHPKNLMLYKGPVSIRTEVSLPSTFDPQFGEWIERPEEIEMLTKRFLKALSYVLNRTIINEGSYVCEVLAPLFNIAFRDLPVNNETWTIWGDMASWPDAVQKGDSRSACRLDFMLVAYVNNERVDVLNMEIGHPNSHKRKQEQDRLKLARLDRLRKNAS